MLLGVVALTIDMGYLWVLRDRLQSTADAAALAGASQLPVELDAKSTAVNYARKNLLPEAHGEVLCTAGSALAAGRAPPRQIVRSGEARASVGSRFNSPRLARGFFFCTRRPDCPYSVWCRINRSKLGLMGCNTHTGTILKAPPVFPFQDGAFFCLIQTS